MGFGQSTHSLPTKPLWRPRSSIQQHWVSLSFHNFLPALPWPHLLKNRHSLLDRRSPKLEFQRKTMFVKDWKIQVEKIRCSNTYLLMKKGSGTWSRHFSSKVAALPVSLFSRCGLCAISLSTPWEFVRDTNSQTTPKTGGIRKSWGWSPAICCNKPSRWLWCVWGVSLPDMLLSLQTETPPVTVSLTPCLATCF